MPPAPQVAMDWNGDAVAVWYQLDEATLRVDIWANRGTLAGGWPQAQLIETDDWGNARRATSRHEHRGHRRRGLDPERRALAITFGPTV